MLARLYGSRHSPLARLGRNDGWSGLSGPDGGPKNQTPGMRSVGWNSV
jgi:hypothetical protein